MTIYEAALKYIAQGTATVVFGGEEYGSGSSRDWAAKGTQLLGVKAVIARSFERIHRSNLVGWACCPCSSSATTPPNPRPRGDELIDIVGLEQILPQQPLTHGRHAQDGSRQEVTW